MEPGKGRNRTGGGTGSSIPEYVFYIKLLEAMFKGTTHTIRWGPALPSPRRQIMLKQFHETWYVPNIAILVIVGNVQLRARPRQGLFGSIPAKSSRRARRSACSP